MVVASASLASANLPRTLLPAEIAHLDNLSYNEQGLIPAIVQDYLDGTVLMMAWMNRESLQKTLETGRTWFWSRSRQALWPKGETSGHVQWVKQIRYDCDSDALVILVEQVGEAACHTGARSCFFRTLPEKEGDPMPAADTLSQVFAVVKARQADPRPDSYTSSLLAKGDNAILKKLGEETAEVVMAAKEGDKAALAREVADLWYHCLVALAHHQVDIRDVYRQLQARRSPQ
ncbi:phosphoribosyl-AMP cyclohydrolase / phosphoribosyl-ATP pyrophosphohydrolase [Thermostichus sp. MS-CIW-21]|jgi:phosphoribosyl-ATP pyrophosphohydrolase/phosphoribosyl-AMP cyclohydrolase|uniref:bifunctional phosphoribosyl-AMP cyclohydrolase/phosphoribosyl-ATP diphosphatase HisIE n=1 Tax=unclassified Synechococcus TaxID=2626047 RepID=UPI001F0AAF36|nr:MULTISPECIES: bifunctional phosphoribosyl-AMP cyclohydrolase/phosphoribosyl-ATP diphosphatase HisIE [unclassified Synechococcus]